jgi:tight adherence protein B
VEALRAVAAYAPPAVTGDLAGVVAAVDRGAAHRADVLASTAVSTPDAPVAVRPVRAPAGAPGPVTAAPDVPQLLRAAARDGAEGLAVLAACWQVAAEGGAPLAGTVERAGVALRADATVRRRLAAVLAGPRSTAQLLTVLPVAALALGEGIGARPLDVLAGPMGWLCVGVGLPLLVVGAVWVGALTRSVESSLRLPGP